MMIITLIGIGIGSGVQPFLGYCFGAKEKDRLMKGIWFSSAFGIILCLVVSALCFILAEPIVKIFLTDGRSLESGVRFSRILLCTGWLIGGFSICQNTLQAIGAATASLLASLFRQGIILVPAIFIMEAILGAEGLIWGQPVADVLSMVLVIIMLKSKLSHADMSKTESECTVQ